MAPRCKLSTLIWTTAAVALLTGLPDALGQSILRNGSFDSGTEGWTDQTQGLKGVGSTWSKDAGRGGGGAVHIHATDVNAQTPLIWRLPLESASAGKKVRFSAWVRGKQCQTGPMICVQAWDKDRKNIIGFGTTQQKHKLTGDFDWTKIESSISVPEKTESLHLLAFLMDSGEVWFDDVSAEVVGDADPAEVRQAQRMDVTAAPPGLFLARGEYEIKSVAAGLTGWMSIGKKGDGKKAETITLLLPIPLSYREQQPLTYELWAEPADRLKSARIYEDKPGNFVAEVILARPIGEPTRLGWKSLVAIGQRSFADVPATAEIPAEWPAEAREWLKATRFAQSDDARIQEIAREIRGDSRDVMKIIARALERTQTIFEKQAGRCSDLGAVQALTLQGSCTSCANLVTALIRACGVPARIIAGYPTWSGPLQTHYIVEAWVPGYGWYPIESTMLKAPLAPGAQLQVSIVPTEYEGDLAAGRPMAASGVPFLSLTEAAVHDGTWRAQGVVPGAPYCDHVAETLVTFDENSSEAEMARLIEQGGKSWRKWLATKPSGEAAGSLRSTIRADELSDSKSPRELLDKLAARAE